MANRADPSIDDDWDEDDEAELDEELAADDAEFEDGEALPVSSARQAGLTWRRIEELREQTALRAQLEDFDSYVI